LGVEKRPVMRLFRRRRFDRIFPAVAAAILLLAVAASPQLAGTGNPLRMLAIGLGVGGIGVVILFAVLKVVERRTDR